MTKSENVRITSELRNPSEMGTHHRFLCMTGPNKGKVYYLIGKRIIIGRGEDADIQIVDVKISREHAELSFADNGYTITDLGAQNGIIVNDSKVKQKKLSDAEKIVIGQTVFKYNIIEVTNTEMIIGDEQAGSLSKETSKTISSKGQQRLKSGGTEDFASKKSKSSEKKGNNKGLVMSIVLLVVGYVLFFDSDETPTQSQNKNKAGLRDIEADFLGTTKNKKNSVEDAESRKKVNGYIHSGRREFSEGNYFRAMEDFRLALLLSPNDGYASFYLSKAKQSLDDDINKNFLKGKQEYESKKLQAAIVSYCGVVQLIQNYPNDERYKNAMLKISAIESELGLEKGEIKCFEAKSADSRD